MKVTFIFCNIKEGYKKFGAEIIREVNDVPFCHFAILVNDTIYEAVFPFSQRIDFKEWKKEYEIYEAYEFNLNEKESDVINFLEGFVGKFYGWDQIFFIAFSIWFNIKKRIYQKMLLNSNTRIICTELGYLFCKRFLTIPDKFENIGQDRVDLRQMYELTVELNKKY